MIFPLFTAARTTLKSAHHIASQAMKNTAAARPEVTLASIQRDFVEWRKERSHYAVWAIDVDIPALRAASAVLREHLADCLLPDYQRQAHVTVHLCGFPAAVPKLDDDYPAAVLQEQIAALQAGAPEPFALKIGAPDSFVSAAYLSVDDCADGILAIRRTLTGSGSNPEYGFPYTPHVTCGLYRGEFSLPELIQRMAACELDLPMHVQIERLTLMAYDAAIIGGPLSILCEFDLATRQIQRLDQALMTALFGQGQVHARTRRPISV